MVNYKNMQREDKRMADYLATQIMQGKLSIKDVREKHPDIIMEVENILIEAGVLHLVK